MHIKILCVNEIKQSNLPPNGRIPFSNIPKDQTSNSYMNISMKNLNILSWRVLSLNSSNCHMIIHQTFEFNSTPQTTVDSYYSNKHCAEPFIPHNFVQ